MVTFITAEGQTSLCTFHDLLILIPSLSMLIIYSDQIREVIGMFMVKGMYRPAENQMLAVPFENVKSFTPQVQRLLGYGISAPSVGFLKYQDPMRVLFGVEDEETVNM